MMSIIGGFVNQKLSHFENSDLPRNEQESVVIHCYSGMPWAAALWAYDAVRAYEQPYMPELTAEEAKDPNRMYDFRQVAFAPTRVDNNNNLDRELFELVRMK